MSARAIAFAAACSIAVPSSAQAVEPDLPVMCPPEMKVFGGGEAVEIGLLELVQPEVPNIEVEGEILLLVRLARMDAQARFASSEADRLSDIGGKWCGP